MPVVGAIGTADERQLAEAIGDGQQLATAVAHAATIVIVHSRWARKRCQHAPQPFPIAVAQQQGKRSDHRIREQPGIQQHGNAQVQPDECDDAEPPQQRLPERDQQHRQGGELDRQRSPGEPLQHRERPVAYPFRWCINRLFQVQGVIDGGAVAPPGWPLLQVSRAEVDQANLKHDPKCRDRPGRLAGSGKMRLAAIIACCGWERYSLTHALPETVQREPGSQRQQQRPNQHRRHDIVGPDHHVPVAVGEPGKQQQG